jgi:hypothetical protein
VLSVNKLNTARVNRDIAAFSSLRLYLLELKTHHAPMGALCLLILRCCKSQLSL